MERGEDLDQRIAKLQNRHTPRLEQTREVEGRVEGVLVRGAEDVAAGGEGLAVELLGLLQLATLLEDEPARSTRGA